MEQGADVGVVFEDVRGKNRERRKHYLQDAVPTYPRQTRNPKNHWKGIQALRKLQGVRASETVLYSVVKSVLDQGGRGERGGPRQKEEKKLGPDAFFNSMGNRG